MELYQEILCHVLANEKIRVSFPELIHTDVTKIVELECYKALAKVKSCRLPPPEPSSSKVQTISSIC